MDESYPDASDIAHVSKLKCTLAQELRLCTGRTAHGGSRGIALLFLDHGTRRGEGSASRPGRFLPPWKTRYPFYGRLRGPQGRSGQVRKISPPPGFDPRTVQPVTSCYTDYAAQPSIRLDDLQNHFRNLIFRSFHNYEFKFSQHVTAKLKHTSLPKWMVLEVTVVYGYPLSVFCNVCRQVASSAKPISLTAVDVETEPSFLRVTGSLIGL